MFILLIRISAKNKNNNFVYTFIYYKNTEKMQSLFTFNIFQNTTLHINPFLFFNPNNRKHISCNWNKIVHGCLPSFLPIQNLEFTRRTQKPLSNKLPPFSYNDCCKKIGKWTRKIPTFLTQILTVTFSSSYTCYLIQSTILFPN